MDWIYYLFYACVIVSIGGIIATVIVFFAYKKKLRLIANNKEKVFVKQLEINESHNGMKAKYYVDFALRNGSQIKLKIKQDLFDNLYVNDSGILVYFKGKILFFEKDETHEHKFFCELNSTSKTMKITMDSPRFNQIIGKEDQVESNQEEVIRYLARMMENKKDHFITLEDEFGNHLEISGNSEKIIDLRYLQKDNIYFIVNTDLEKVMQIVKSFYENADLSNIYHFQREK